MAGGPVNTAGFVEELEQWRSEVPSHLAGLFQMSSTADWNPMDFEQTCIVLTFRFLMVRMLVYRPVISQAVEVSKRESLGNYSGSVTPTIDYNACLLGLASCTQDALRIVNIGSALAKARVWPRGGSVWYRLYYRKSVSWPKTNW